MTVRSRMKFIRFSQALFIWNLSFSPDGEIIEVNAEVVIGADGARSAIRNELMKRPRYKHL